MKSALACRSGIATDRGPYRELNEDRVWADDATGVYIVVDGVGGQAAGDVAAETALDVLVGELSHLEPDLERQVRRAIARANNAVFDLASGVAAYAGMACVLTVAVVRDDAVAVGHVGDTRLYLIWNGTLRKLTPDHSPVGELEDAGALSEPEARAHPRRHEVFRDVGAHPREPFDDDFIDYRTFPLHSSAALLLATDGLTDVLPTAAIAEVVETYGGDPGETALRLVERAYAAGATDNVSVVLVAAPGFLGVDSAEMAQARARHVITRPRTVRFASRRLLWTLTGMVLGIVLYALIQHYGGRAGW